MSRNDGPLVVRAVAVGVFEDDDAVVALAVVRPLRVADRHSTTHIRPRSSKVNAIGCTTSGSPAKSVALKPSGSVILLRRFGRRDRAVLGGSRYEADEQARG